MQATLDTNILARATFSRKGPARRAVEELTIPPHELILSEAVLTELDRILRYPRVRPFHGFDDARIEAEIQALRDLARIVVPSSPAGPAPIVASDPTDDVVIATAVAGNVEVLCTLDKHFRRAEVLDFCRQHGIRVLTDVELLHELHN